MGQIYSRASRVRICVGRDHNDHAESVAAFLYLFNQMFESALQTARGWDSFPWPKPNDPILKHPGWKSVAFLLRQPWFYRGWVVQEAGLAREAWIHWGAETFSWRGLVRAVVWSTRRGGSLLDLLRVRPPVLHVGIYKAVYKHEAKTLFPAHLLRTWSFLETLHYARYLGVTDQRDRIFAFLGLPAAARTLQHLSIDYKKSYSEVYWDFACSYLDQHGGLELLNFLNHDEATLSEEAQCPSWVPQWHGSEFGFTIWKHSHDRRISSRSTLSHGKSQPKPVVRVNRNLLRVRGMLMDSVAAVIHGPFTSEATVQELAAAWARVDSHSQSNPTVYSKFPAILAYFHALVHGSTPFINSHKKAQSRDETYIHRLQQTQAGSPARLSTDDDDDDDPDLLDIDYLHAHIQRCVHNRCVAVTQRGYISLVPRATQEGDTCCIMLGAFTPFVLRKTGWSTGRQSHYKVVGEALMVSKRSPSARRSPYQVGSGRYAHEDWLQLGLKEEDVLIC